MPPKPSDKKTQPKEVRAVRTPHGTRVMKRIVCSHCGKSDTLAFVPRDNHPMLCRECAELDLSVRDESPMKKHERTVKCRVCGKATVTATSAPPADAIGAADRTDPICHDCALAAQAARRKDAPKPKGVHPLVVKRSKN
jgi:CxxC-x17-CxxC domain-containing protein